MSSTIADKSVEVNPHFLLDEDSITTKLKFYSKIQKDEKIESHPLSVTKDNLFNTIYRTLFGSKDRYKALDDIREIVHNVFMIVDKWLSRTDKELYLQYLLLDLNAVSTQSLVNLQQTYEGDKFYSSSIEKINQTINSNIYALMMRSELYRNFIITNKLFLHVKLNPTLKANELDSSSSANLKLQDCKK